MLGSGDGIIVVCVMKNEVFMFLKMMFSCLFMLWMILFMVGVFLKLKLIMVVWMLLLMVLMIRCLVGFIYGMVSVWKWMNSMCLCSMWLCLRLCSNVRGMKLMFGVRYMVVLFI